MKNQQRDLFDILRRAPAAPFSSTSVEAAKAVTKSGRHRSIQEQVLGVLKYRRVLGIDGATDEEIHFQLPGCRLASVVSARNSLVKIGKVEKTDGPREARPRA